MGISERKLRQKQELRQNILVEARRLMKEEGCAAISIRKIADAIEYSAPVVYEHFENKDALLKEFVKEGFGMLAEYVGKAADEMQYPSAQLEAIGHAYWNFAFEHKEHYQLMFGLGMPSCETVREVEEVKRFTDVLYKPLTTILEQHGKKENTFLKLHSYWSMLHGLVSINLMTNDASEKEMNKLVLKDMISVFIKGLGG